MQRVVLVAVPQIAVPTASSNLKIRQTEQSSETRTLR